MFRLSKDEAKEQIDLLNTHRRTLALLLQQQAIHGNAAVPPNIIHGILDARKNIARIKRVLRESGYTVRDHPNDEFNDRDSTPVKISSRAINESRSAADSSWKNWGDHPIVVLISVVGTIVGLIVFITGGQSLQSLLNRGPDGDLSNSSVAVPHQSNNTLATPNTDSLGSNLYLCRSGLCLGNIGTSSARNIVDNWQSTAQLCGFAFSSDGKQVVYCLQNSSSDEVASLFISNIDGSGTRKLFDVQSTSSGSDTITGFSVLGLTQDNSQIIFEEKSQVFIGNLDGKEKRAITDVLPYGVSSTHYFYLSENREKLMKVGTGIPSQIVIYDIASSTQQRYELDYGVAVIGFGRDENHVIQIRVDPPYNIDFKFNEAVLDKVVVGLEEGDIKTGSVNKILDVTNGTRMSTMIRSNSSKGKYLFGIGRQAFFIDLTNNTSMEIYRLPFSEIPIGIYGHEIAIYAN